MAERHWYYTMAVDGTPVPTDMRGWSDFHGKFENRRTAVEEIDGTTISTVWLGIDHQYGDGPPLLWETQVFGSEHPDLADYCEQYSTLADAKAGHARIVELVRHAGRLPAEQEGDD